MRRFGIHYLVFLLVVSFSRDPLAHLHDGHEHGPGEPGHELLALPFHTHLEVETSSVQHHDEPEINTHKSSAKAQPLSFFHFRPETSPPLPALKQEEAVVSSLVCLILKTSEPPPRAHDPPFVHSSIPRSPPV